MAQDVQTIPPTRPQRTITLKGGWDDPHCARPTRAFRGDMLREHGDPPSYPPLFQHPVIGHGGLPVLSANLDQAAN